MLANVKAFFLARDVSRPMSGNFDMEGNTVRNIKPSVVNDNINPLNLVKQLISVISKNNANY